LLTTAIAGATGAGTNLGMQLAMMAVFDGNGNFNFDPSRVSTDNVDWNSVKTSGIIAVAQSVVMQAYAKKAEPTATDENDERRVDRDDFNKENDENLDVLRKNDDPFRNALGSGIDTHPEEWNAIVEHMREQGVEITFRKGAMAYAPSTGKPGQLIIDPDASFGALLHEYTHFNDDARLGFPGMEYHYQTINRVQMELNAYMREIRLAESLGYKNVAEALFESYRSERSVLISHLR